MARVVLGEDELLKRAQADVAADGSVGQLSIWHRRGKCREKLPGLRI